MLEENELKLNKIYKKIREKIELKKHFIMYPIFNKTWIKFFQDKKNGHRSTTAACLKKKIIGSYFSFKNHFYKRCLLTKRNSLLIINTSCIFIGKCLNETLEYIEFKFYVNKEHYTWFFLGVFLLFVKKFFLNKKNFENNKEFGGKNINKVITERSLILSRISIKIFFFKNKKIKYFFLESKNYNEILSEMVDYSAFQFFKSGYFSSRQYESIKYDCNSKKLQFIEKKLNFLEAGFIHKIKKKIKRFFNIKILSNLLLFFIRWFILNEMKTFINNEKKINSEFDYKNALISIHLHYVVIASCITPQLKLYLKKINQKDVFVDKDKNYFKLENINNECKKPLRTQYTLIESVDIGGGLFPGKSVVFERSSNDSENSGVASYFLNSTAISYKEISKKNRTHPVIMASMDPGKKNNGMTVSGLSRNVLIGARGLINQGAGGPSRTPQPKKKEKKEKKKEESRGAESSVSIKLDKRIKKHQKNSSNRFNASFSTKKRFIKKKPAPPINKDLITIFKDFLEFPFRCQSRMDGLSFKVFTKIRTMTPWFRKSYWFKGSPWLIGHPTNNWFVVCSEFEEFQKINERSTRPEKKMKAAINEYFYWLDIYTFKANQQRLFQKELIRLKRALSEERLDYQATHLPIFRQFFDILMAQEVVEWKRYHSFLFKLYKKSTPSTRNISMLDFLMNQNQEAIRMFDSQERQRTILNKNVAYKFHQSFGAINSVYHSTRNWMLRELDKLPDEPGESGFMRDESTDENIISNWSGVWGTNFKSFDKWPKFCKNYLYADLWAHLNLSMFTGGLMGSRKDYDEQTWYNTQNLAGSEGAEGVGGKLQIFKHIRKARQKFHNSIIDKVEGDILNKLWRDIWEEERLAVQRGRHTPAGVAVNKDVENFEFLGFQEESLTEKERSAEYRRKKVIKSKKKTRVADKRRSGIGLNILNEDGAHNAQRRRAHKDPDHNERYDYNNDRFDYRNTTHNIRGGFNNDDDDNEE